METLSFQEMLKEGKIPRLKGLTGKHGTDVVTEQFGKLVIGCLKRDGQPIEIIRKGKKRFELRCAALTGSRTKSSGTKSFCSYDPQRGSACPLMDKFIVEPTR